MKPDQRMFDALGTYFGNLRDRWQDEKQYEDFSDYIDAVKKKVNEVEGAEFVRMEKRPFSFKWKADGAEFLMSATAKRILITRLVTAETDGSKL